MGKRIEGDGMGTQLVSYSLVLKPLADNHTNSLDFFFPQQIQPPLPTSSETGIASCHDIQQIHT